MPPTDKTLTELFKENGLKELKEYVYCDMIEKLFQFAVLNKKCEQDGRMPGADTNSPQERFKQSAAFDKQAWSTLASKLESAYGDMGRTATLVKKRISQMRGVIGQY